MTEEAKEVVATSIALVVMGLILWFLYTVPIGQL